jgi:TetR/AcrR family transcriptional repressor of mexJK operon
VPKTLRSRGSARRDATREAILSGALRCFARDGYRRTALDRVAREADISRAALYLHFANKEQLFRALVGALHARTLAEAADAARRTGSLAERLTAALAAKSARFFDLLRGSEHADEFLGEHHRLCGELSAEVSAKHARLLARMLATAAAAGEISLAGAGLSATHAAELLLATAEGIKARGRTTLSARAYQQRLGQAVRIVIAGLARPAAARGNVGARRVGASS